MYIIWKYDIFPYKLCGKVIKKNKNGRYTVQGYGAAAFEAVKVIKSDKKGEEVQAILIDAGETYRAESSDLLNKHNESLSLLLAKLTGL